MIRFNRGNVDSPADLPKASKKAITRMFRQIIPRAFEQTTNEIAKKHKLEWFRVRLHFNQGGAVTEAAYELPTASGSHTVTRFYNQGGARHFQQSRPNAAHRTI